jgi:acyl dehydratase
VSLRFHVDPLAARRFAQAVGDLNPAYFDEAAARAAGHAGLIAPPTFVTSQNSWTDGPPEGELFYDGVNPDRFPGAVSPEATLMGGSQEVELRRAIRQGEDLDIEVAAVDSYVKDTSRGPLTFFVVEATFRDAGGEVVVVARDTVVTAPRG